MRILWEVKGSTPEPETIMSILLSDGKIGDFSWTHKMVAREASLECKTERNCDIGCMAYSGLS